MKILPTVDFVKEYIKMKYPHSILLYIDCPQNNENIWGKEGWVYSFGKKHVKTKELDFYAEILDYQYILLEFDNLERALEFCNKIPDSEPYCCVYQNGRIIHENT